ncbi:hypothetical protein [Lactococcus protaetiae]|uniref:hypothetical protein n=1 Tax=Lactococcus protaetiae TaxID=2592653 RepID=UPI001680FEAE|nr:hypothetical protein [Lactococcus protaetiae]
MKNEDDFRLKQADSKYEPMVDLATRQLAERMAERAVVTYELYKYDYFKPQFISDFIAEFVISAYANYWIKPEHLDEESMLILFVNLASENMRGVPNEAVQYHRLFGQLCDLYYEQGCLRGVLVDDFEYKQMLLGILADIYSQKLI